MKVVDVEAFAIRYPLREPIKDAVSNLYDAMTSKKEPKPKSAALKAKQPAPKSSKTPARRQARSAPRAATKKVEKA